MINIETLDKTKTYVAWQIGTGFVARLIQKLSQKQTKLACEQIASHVLAIVFLDDWYVFESHMKWQGCKKLRFSDWLKEENPENFFVKERPLNVDTLEFYADPMFNPGYSLAEIKDFAIEELTPLDFWNDKPGMVCSEYIANADDGFGISYKTKLKCNKIKPVHWQNELMKG